MTQAAARLMARDRRYLDHMEDPNWVMIDLAYKGLTIDGKDERALERSYVVRTNNVKIVHDQVWNNETRGPRIYYLVCNMAPGGQVFRTPRRALLHPAVFGILAHLMHMR